MQCDAPVHNPSTSEVDLLSNIALGICRQAKEDSITVEIIFSVIFGRAGTLTEGSAQGFTLHLLVLQI